MALAEMSVAGQRYRAVLEVKAGVPVTGAAARAGVSRQSVHAWVRRYEQGGPGALADRPKRPDTCPHQTSAQVEAAVCEMRREHPKWGPLRLAHELGRAGVSPAPSRMSVYRVLVRHGLVEPGPRKRPKDSYLRWERDEPMALTALRKRQLEESTIAGTAYQSRLAELNWYQGGEYVITDEAGTPVHPEWYSDEFGRLLRRAGLRRITLHDSRHTTLTLMEHAGVPISIISKWAGHYDSAFTQKTYVHASEEDLQRGQAALAKIHKIA